MLEFVMLAGLPGSGKSTYANKYKDKYVVLSSDAIREELYGDENDQTDPSKVFDLMFKRAVEALNAGKSVLYDATNIKRRLRIDTLQRLEKAVKETFTKTILVIYTNIDEVKRRNASRARVVPEIVIDNMLKSFEFPVYNEGWNVIKVEYSTEPCIPWSSALAYFTKDVEHDTPFHKLNVYDHSNAVYNYYKEHYDNDNYPKYLANVMLFHDIGKKFCKTFTNRKGETTEIAHFYNHANVGAYLMFDIKLACTERAKYMMAMLINFHMRPLEAWRDSENAKLKDQNLLGEELSKYLDILNDCDIHAEDNV